MKTFFLLLINGLAVAESIDNVLRLWYYYRRGGIA